MSWFRENGRVASRILSIIVDQFSGKALADFHRIILILLIKRISKQTTGIHYSWLSSHLSWNSGCPRYLFEDQRWEHGLHREHCPPRYESSEFDFVCQKRWSPLFSMLSVVEWENKWFSRSGLASGIAQNVHQSFSKATRWESFSISNSFPKMWLVAFLCAMCTQRTALAPKRVWIRSKTSAHPKFVPNFRFVPKFCPKSVLLMMIWRKIHFQIWTA